MCFKRSYAGAENKEAISWIILLIYHNYELTFIKQLDLTKLSLSDFLQIIYTLYKYI